MARSTTRRTGFGTINLRKDGRWEGAVVIGQTEAGNPKRVRVYGRTRAEAAEKLEELRVKKHLGKPLKTESQKLGDYLDQWLANSIKPKRAPTTYRYYEQMVRLYIKPIIGHVPLGTITALHVDQLVNHWAKPRKKDKMELPPLKAHSINGIRSTLRSALSAAWKYNLIPENPVARVAPVARDQEEVVYLTPEEVGRLKEACKGHYIANLIEFALLTGVRVGEALGLRWEDVDLVDGMVRIRYQLQRVEGSFALRPPKSASGRRTLALVPTTGNLLQDQQANQLLWKSASTSEFNPMGLVFTGVDGRPLYQKNVDVLLKRFADKAKIKKTISFHKLRHTLATHAAASGKISLAALKDQLGHSQISVTINTYGHAVPTALRGLAEIVEASYKREPEKQG